MCQCQICGCCWWNCCGLCGGVSNLYCCFGCWCCRPDDMRIYNDECCICCENTGFGFQFCCYGWVMCSPTWILTWYRQKKQYLK